MRPLALTLDGFTSYKQHQEVALADLDLFAICGPTGAGKTSLLDGIVFALYGKVPRLRAGYTDLITQGLSQMAVTLTFRLGGKVYKVARRAYSAKGRGAVAFLEEHTDGAVQVLAEGMPGVTDRIEKLLGLPYEAFTQAVLLPQGKFAEFLQCRAGDRTKLLRDILGYRVYDHMQKQAEQRKRDLSARVELLESTLATEYAGATPEAVAERQTVLAAAKVALAKAGEDARAARQIAEETAQRFQQSAELAAAGSALADLGRQESNIRGYRTRIEAAERAQPVLPTLSAVAEIDRLVEAQRGTVRTAAAAVTAARREETRTTDGLHKAEVAAKNLPRLKDRIRDLDGLTGLLRARTDKQKALTDAESRQTAAASNLARDREAAAALDERLSALQGNVREGEQALKELAYDETVDQRLEQAKPTAVTLKSVRKAARQAAADAVEADQELGAAKKAQSAADEALEAAVRSRDDAKAKLDAVEAALAEAQQEHAAAHLRAGLKIGERCPVCEQTVGKRPPRLAVPGLDALVAKRATVNTRLEAAEQKRAAAAKEAAEIGAAATKAVRDAAKAREKATATDQEVADTEKALSGMVKGGSLPPRGTLEDRVIEATEAIAALRRRHTKLQADVGKAREQYATTLAKHEAVLKSIATFAEQEKAAAADVRELTAGLAALTRDIRKVTTNPDPEAERANVAQRVKDIEATYQDARAKAVEAGANLKNAETHHTKAQEELAAREERATALRAKAAQAAAAAGFPSWEAAARAQLAQGEMTTLRARVTSYDEQRTRLSDRVAELKALLKGAAVTEAQLRQVQKAATTATDAAGEAAKTVGVSETEIRQLEERVDKAKGLQAQLAGLGMEFAVYKQLAEDLRASGGGFQSFMLEEAFTDIAAAASERLLALTHNRYGLRYAGEGTILVVDHDNAAQERGTDTLSGGETFMASLALALELSEQVRRRHYGVSLDSLFIDEGFSTLDPDALEGAAEAITAVGQSGRMVGIITHLHELAAQLPVRIEVDRQPDGSRVRVLSA